MQTSIGEADSLDILFYVSGAPIPNLDHAAVAERGTPADAVAAMAAALSDMGHAVTVAGESVDSNPEARPLYLPSAELSARMRGRSWDLLLTDGPLALLGIPVFADMIGLWPQVGPSDIALHQLVSSLTRASFVMFSGEFHRAEFERRLPGISELAWSVPPALDIQQLGRVRDETPSRPSETRALYVGAPDEGLDVLLLDFWPKFRARHPDAQLAVWSPGLSRSSPQPALNRYCVELVDRFDSVELVDGSSREDLWRAVTRSLLVLQPTNQPALTARLALEVQALGRPIVVPDRFAFPESVGFAECRVPAAWRDPSFFEGFLECAHRLVEDASFYDAACSTGLRHVETSARSWNGVALKWTEHVMGRFARRFETHRRGVLRRLVRESDREAARHLVASTADPSSVFDARDLHALEREQTDEPAVPLGLHHEESVTNRNQELGAAIRWLTGSADATVLDVGGGAVDALSSLLAETPGLVAACLALDSRPAESASSPVGEPSVAERFATVRFPVKRTFDEVVTYDALTHDVVVVTDLLQRCGDPSAVVDWAQSRARLGVVGSVPAGPWSELSTDPWQRHQFDARALFAMLGHKTDFRSVYVAAGTTPRGEALGFWVFGFRTQPSAPTGSRTPVDVRIQRTRPLPTLAATIIVKDGEADLSRCIASLEPVVDQILLGDTGSTDNTLALAERLGFTPEPEGRKALLSVSFEDFAQARNVLVDATSADYLLSLDADEFLTQPEELRPFIDDNVFFDSYTFELRNATLDLEAGRAPHQRLRRLFKSVGSKGPLRWFGCVHEVIAFDLNDHPHRDFWLPANQFIAHTGYLYEAVRADKALKRNLPLLIKDRRENPQREIGYFLGMRQYVAFARTELARVGHMTERAYRWLNYAWEIWSGTITEFEHPMRELSFEVSREILELLGKHGVALRSTRQIPFEAEFSFAARVGGLNPEGAETPTHRSFYATVEELREEWKRQMSRAETEIIPEFGHTPSMIWPDDRGGRDGAIDLPPELFELEPFDAER